MRLLNELLPLDTDVRYEIDKLSIDKQERHMRLALRTVQTVDENAVEALRAQLIEHFQLQKLTLSVVIKTEIDGLDRSVWLQLGDVPEIEAPKPAPMKSAPPKRKRVRKVTKIKDMVVGKNKYTIEGYIFSARHMPDRRNKGEYTITFAVSDDSGAVRVRYGVWQNSKYTTPLNTAKLKQQAVVGATVVLTGTLKENRYIENGEPSFILDSLEVVEPEYRRDDAEHKRVELHLHTNMSAEDATSDVKRLVAMAARWGHAAVAITDHGVVHSFPDAMAAAKKHKIKVLYGVEGYLCDDAGTRRADESLRHITVLVRNQTGLRNLYQLVSDSHLHYFYRRPRYDRALLTKHRDGLLFGSACERGELFEAIVRGDAEDKLVEIARFYDYLEIMPLCNNAFMIDKGLARDEEQLREYNRTVVALGEQLGIPVVATGDVHFCDPEDEVYRTILNAHKKYDLDSQQPFYLKTTDEMLAEFDYLGEDKAFEVVVTNPNAIANSIDVVRPIRKGEFFPKIEGDADELRKLTWEGARRFYGENWPPMLEERVNKELNSIINHGYAMIYISAQRLIARSEQCGYQVGSRGSVGSSIVAFFAGITEVNSLPPHYRCGQCKAWEFPENQQAECGPDLPDKSCPKCGAPYIKDGYDISFAIFLGFEADKKPDIDLNFSGEYQAEAHKHTLEMFGERNVFKAGTISTIKEKTALAYVGEYLESMGDSATQVEREALAHGVVGVRRSTGQHPGGLIIVPDHMDINDFCPVQHPANNAKSGIVTTHFDYHSIEDNLLKLDLLGHDNPTILKMLADLTGIPSETVPLGDPAVMSIFRDSSVLGYSKDELLGPVGTVAIPEFGTNFVRGMLATTQPTTFDELLRISGLSHGEMVWQNNAEELIKAGTATLKNVVGTRDDILHTLLKLDMDAKTAFTIMEKIRKGKGNELTKDELIAMESCGTPRWYIESCQKINYLFPKSHAVAYVVAAFRIAWYKVNHPLAFYSAYFSIRAKTFEVETMTRGEHAVHKRAKLLKAKGDREASENDILEVAEVAYEYAKRGFSFLPVDLYKSDASLFLMEEGGLRLPFTVIPSLGDVAAQEIVKQRTTPFKAVDDLQIRCTKLTKTHIGHLRALGALDALPDTLQTTLFEF